MTALARPPVGYPIARSGGLFLLLIGAGLLAALAASGDAPVNHGVFYAALAAALFSLFFARRLSFGRPTPLQVAVGAWLLSTEPAVVSGLH